MRAATLPAGALPAFLDSLRSSAVLYAPKRTPGGTFFAEIAAAADVDLAAANTVLSLKGVFFPQREVLCGYRDGSVASVPGPGRGEAPAAVVFGARPCDARSMGWLDAVFSSGGEAKQDPYFLGRRRAAVVIALACDAPCASCFCTSVGGSPYGAEGADLLASRGDGAFLLEAVTEKGEALLAAHTGLLAAASPADIAARERRAAAAAAKLTVLDFSGIKERLEAAFDAPAWQAITRRCLGCGACTWGCPTCHCFDITDEGRAGRGQRIRTWDGCQFPPFTLHASGHNPRAARAARMRQRLMHKYAYAPESAGATFCSGCGRCVRQCPVNLDIREMLAAVKALA